MISPTLYYIICVVLSLLSLLGISMMSKVSTSVRGNLLLSLCLLAGCVVTLWYYQIFDALTIYALMLLGTLVGAVLAYRVQMIQMPQTVAMLNGLGGLAGAIVGALTLVHIGVKASDYPVFVNVTATLAVVVGMVTFVGSMIAAGKLHRILSQKSIVWKNHRAITLFLLAGSVVSVVLSFFIGRDWGLPTDIRFILAIATVFGSLFGWAFAIRVGGADMPITISLLTSLAGIAAAIAGMAIGDLLVVSIGGIVGSSGLLLTRIMCRAMNRSLTVILTGKTSVAPAETKTGAAQAQPQAVVSGKAEACAKEAATAPATGGVHGTKPAQAPETASFAQTPDQAPAGPSLEERLRAAKRAVIVPGYGMALAQAQHHVRQLADLFEKQGTDVKYAIHPVAGRMPGHMNVLLAEADVAYDQLYEMESINDDFKDTDMVVVIGANDVLNPAARDAEGTPIYGMPVLNVDQAKYVVICNFDTKPGYAGVPNPLYEMTDRVTLMLGDAKESLTALQRMLSNAE